MSSWIDSKYIALMASRLERYKNTGRDTHIFRCPYCGDSQSNKSKARGYFYAHKDKMKFKCHNCGQSCGLRDFIKEICPDLYRPYLFDYFGRQEKPAEETVPEAFKTSNLSERFKTKLDFLSNFKSLSSLPPDQEGRAYIEGRKIPLRHLSSLYWVEDANDVFKRLELYKEKKWKTKFSAVMIPFHSSEDDGFKLMFVQLRFMSDDAPSRYLTLEVEGGEKIWGLDKLDMNKDIMVFEGALDAMCVENAVGSGGADLLDTGLMLKEKTTKNVSLVWDADFVDNAEVKNRLVRAVNMGMQVVITDSGLKGKDVNEAIKNGQSPNFVMDYLKTRTFSSLDAQLELSRFRKPTKTPQKGANGHRKKDKDVPSFT